MRRRRIHELAGLLARVGHHVGLPSIPRDLAATLAAAGLDDRVRLRDAMAIKVGAASGRAVVDDWARRPRFRDIWDCWR